MEWWDTLFQLEKAILRKGIYDAETTKLTSYEKIKANCYILFPYKEINGKPKLYTLEEMQRQFPYGGR